MPYNGASHLRYFPLLSQEMAAQHAEPLPEIKLTYHQRPTVSVTHLRLNQNTKFFIQGNATENVCKTTAILFTHKNHFVFAPSRWETTVQWNVVSHWMSACIEWSRTHTTQSSRVQQCWGNQSDQIPGRVRLEGFANGWHRKNMVE